MRAWRCTSRSRDPPRRRAAPSLFAGFTVVIALCSLAFAGIPLVSTLGFTAAIAVVIAVCAAIDASARDARRPWSADQLAARAARQDPPRRQEAARLAALGGAVSPRGHGARRSAPSSFYSSSPPRSPSWNWDRTTSARCPSRPPPARPTTGLSRVSAPVYNGPLLIASEFKIALRSPARPCQPSRRRSPPPTTSTAVGRTDL